MPPKGWLRLRVSCLSLSCSSAVRSFLFSWPFRLLFHGPPGQAGRRSAAVQRASKSRSSWPPWQRLLCPACFPSGNTVNPWLSACLHPLGVAVLLTIQWYALLRKIAGQQVTWKERAYRVG